jgi:hypothetical protein
MSLPTNRMSYAGIYEVYDKALEDPKGIRLPFNSEKEAMYFRMRMHQARAIDRKENSQIYPPGEPLHGQSQYDLLSIRLIGPIEDPASPTGETTFLYIERRENIVPEVESLSEIDQTEELE